MADAFSDSVASAFRTAARGFWKWTKSCAATGCVIGGVVGMFGVSPLRAVQIEFDQAAKILSTSQRFFDRRLGAESRLACAINATQTTAAATALIPAAGGLGVGGAVGYYGINRVACGLFAKGKKPSAPALY